MTISTRPHIVKNVILTIALFIFCIGNLAAQIYFVSFPKDMQLYPRDPVSNTATINMSGTAEIGTGNALQLRVFRDSVLIYTETQGLNYVNDFAGFSFEAMILAELANYTFELHAEQDDDFVLVKTVSNVVAGDVYVITGQSNALASRRDSAASAAYLENPFIRSFASGKNNTSVAGNLYWYQGRADTRHEVNGNVGQWGMEMADLILEEHQIPVAIFNGAIGGSNIVYHKRNNNDPTDLLSSYGRLLYRLEQAGVADAVRAIFWWQGETDAKFGMPRQTYKNHFYDIYKGWENDFPGFEALFMMQVRTGCATSPSDAVQIQEAQRQLANELPKAHLMTAKGIAQWTDDCHFGLSSYEAVGERMAAALMNEVYMQNVSDALPNDVLSIEQLSSDIIALTLKYPLGAFWETGAETDFELIGTNATVTSGWVSGNQVLLILSAPTSGLTGVTYYDHEGYAVTTPYIKNSKEIGLPSFFDFPVGQPMLVAENDIYTLSEDMLLLDNVLNNDTLNVTSGLTVSLIEDVTNGQLSLQPSGSFTYLPNAHFNGTDSLRYSVCSSARLDYCKEATVHLTINAVNDPPYAADDFLAIVQNNPGSDNMLVNDFDVDNQLFILNTTPIIPPINGSVVIDSLGNYTYTPNSFFNGNDAFSYRICDADTTGLCSIAQVYITVADNGVNDAPVPTNDTLTINEDQLGTSNLLANDWDPEGDEMIATSNPIDLPKHGAAIINSSGLYYYIPDSDFYGVDSFSYQVCDNGIPELCNAGWVHVNINSVNDPPLANNDTLIINDYTAFNINILDNDIDQDGDALFVPTDSIIPSLNGILNIEADGTVYYQPNTGFFGTEKYTYQICDTGTPNQCVETTLVLIVEQACIDVQLAVWLEGAYDTLTNEMSTALNTERGVLPSQTPTNEWTSPTPPGQPYTQAPWNYTGTEGMEWRDADYTPEMVDWVLVSFRTEEAKASEVSRSAGVILKDGQIFFPEACVLPSIFLDSLYIVVEHRNHMGIMTPTLVASTDNVLTYDFRIGNTYKDASSFGQKEMQPGIWAMYGGDGTQEVDGISYDISGLDKALWIGTNGFFDLYLPADYNMDGEVNGGDKAFWSRNNGLSSRVPR